MLRQTRSVRVIVIGAGFAGLVRFAWPGRTHHSPGLPKARNADVVFRGLLGQLPTLVIGMRLSRVPSLSRSSHS